MDAKTFFTKVVLMRKAQKDYSSVAPNKTCGNARHLKRKLTEKLNV